MRELNHRREAARRTSSSHSDPRAGRIEKESVSPHWDGYPSEGFWDLSSVEDGWGCTLVDLGDPALSFGTVDERFSWTVTDWNGAEVATGTSNDVNQAAEDAEFAYLMSSDPELNVAKKASRRTASISMWDSAPEEQHKVAGWDWDDHLSGYVAEGSSSHFSCICGSNVEAPGYQTCACGKLWNSYPITTEAGTRVICREVPVRDMVLAKRKTAGRKTASPQDPGEDALFLPDTAESFGLWNGYADAKRCRQMQMHEFMPTRGLSEWVGDHDRLLVDLYWKGFDQGVKGVYPDDLGGWRNVR